MAESGGAVKLLELDTTVLGSEEELKEKDCGAGAGVSNAENLGKERTDCLSICMCVYKPQCLSQYTLMIGQK